MNLTLEIARQYLADPYSMDLDAYQTIDDDAAKALAAHRGDLYLNGLKSLSDDVANALAEHGSSDRADELQLEGLESLSDNAAKALCRREGYVGLSRHVLTMLSMDVAEALTSHNDEWMQIGQATRCQRSDGPIYYNADRLDSTVAAEILAGCSGGDLHLNNVTVLSADAAKRIARHDGECIYLDGLETMSLDVARALAGFRGAVYLRGLPPLDIDNIPDECSEMFQIEWVLAMQDPEFGYGYKPTKLDSYEVAERLTRLYPESLDLDAVKILAPDAASAFAEYAGEELSLNGLATLSVEVARELAQFNGGLHLDGLTSLDVHVADALVKTNGDTCWMSLNRLTNLSVESAKALARHAHSTSGESFTWTLSLNRLKTLSVEVAAALTGHGNKQTNFKWEQLSLDGLTDLSAEAAKVLVWHNDGRDSICEQLSLNGLTSLTDELAEALAEHVGKLSLDGLTGISDQAAESLGKHKGGVSLDSLSDALCRAMCGEPQNAFSGEAAASLLRVWDPYFD